MLYYITYLVISFFLNLRSYWALIAREATKLQSDTTVCKKQYLTDNRNPK